MILFLVVKNMKLFLFLVPRWDLGPELVPGGARVGPRWDQSWSQMGPELVPGGTRVGPRWDQSWSQMGPELVPDGTRVGPKGFSLPQSRRR